MTKIYYDTDADLSVISGKKIAIIGFGNQGRAHALNLRDSGQDVLIGNIDDSYGEDARREGFQVESIADASKKGDVICILTPDEVQSEIFVKEIEPHLSVGKSVMFASGFNIHFGFIKPPKFVDVIMEAPRMIGIGVRELYQRGLGCATLIAVHQDYTGNAKKTVLAIAKGIGATRLGAFESSFEEEAVLDLFSEQAFWGGFYELLTAWMETAINGGYDELVSGLELYCSGEMLEEIKAVLGTGAFRQMSYHSTTSQYGSITRGKKIVTPEVKESVKRILTQIENGNFAREWRRVQKRKPETLEMAHKKLLSHRINRIEDKLENIRKQALKALSQA